MRARLITLCCLLCMGANTAEADTTKLHAYIVAHPDDWQLFMGDTVYPQITSGDHVTFIYLSAGGADRPPAYWHAREAGAMASIRAAATGGNDLKGPIEARCGQVIVRSHPIQRCSEGSTDSYFLRLPDGRPDGSGYLQSGYQSLDKLAHGQPMAAVDGSTTYLSLTGIEEVVIGLLEHELVAANATGLVLHTHDPSPMSNRYDHADHRMAGNIVMSVAAKLNVDAFYYAGYGIADLPANLSDEAINMKQRVFAAYDRERILANPTWSAYAEWPEAYAAWMSRTYKREEPRQH